MRSLPTLVRIASGRRSFDVGCMKKMAVQKAVHRSGFVGKVAWIE